MSDPLSVSASIAGLIALADLTFKVLYKYVRSAKDAKGDIHALADEVNGLASILRTLQALASELEDEGDVFDPTLRIHHLGQCKKTLDKIEKRVKRATDSFARSRLEGITRQLKWPFSSSEVKELLVELSRHKETINLALTADSMQKLQLSLSKAEELGKQVSAVEQVVREIKINTLITVNDRKQRILDYFIKVSPQPNLETSIRLRHAMTGLWLTESPEFTHWLETPGSRLWLTGIPGAGKTVLAGSVVQEALTRCYSAENIGAGFFFCDYKNHSTADPVNILGAVASQLARQKDGAFDILSAYYDELHPPRGLPKTPDAEELRTRIGGMSKLFDQTIIVIDGFDECGDRTDDVVEVLSALTEYYDGISTALFSRDHYNIRFRLEENFKIVPIAAHTDDIRLYVGAELDRRLKTRQLQLTDLNMKSEILETLVNRAQGMFRWVVCQLDYLCDCAHDGERREALTKLPPDLPESYRRLLERLNRCSPRVQNIVQMCLQFIAYAEPKLTIAQLQQAVSTPEAPGASLDKSNTVSAQEIARRCSSLIRKSEDGRYFEFAHFTVQEFLENEDALSEAPGRPGLEVYLIDGWRSDELLAAQCLRFLQLKNFDRQPSVSKDEAKLVLERDDEYPFYEYSALRWMSLTEDGFEDPVVLGLAMSLFHPSKTSFFSAWAIEVLHFIIHSDDEGYGSGAESNSGDESNSEDENNDSGDNSGRKPDRRVLEKVLDPSFRPLHMAAALNLPEICSFLLGEGVPPNSRSSTARPIDLAFVSIVGMPEVRIALGLNSQGRLFNLGGKGFGLSNKGRLLLPATERRNKTIDCLLEKGAKPSNHSLSYGASSVFSIVCDLAEGLFNDFTPVVQLLNCSVIPEEVDIDAFETCLQSCFRGDSVESSTLKLLQYLNSPAVSSTEWSLRMTSILWNWALKNNLSYTSDPFIIDSRVSMSQEALEVKMLAAIASDDVEAVKRTLADGRLELTASYSDEGQTLLHIAAKDMAFDAFQILLDAGCDPYLEDAEGDLPVHTCVRSGWYFQQLSMLWDCGVSLWSQNADGHTILHICVEEGNLELLEPLMELDLEATAKALLTKTLEGDTPLSLLLKQPHPDEYNDLENTALRFVELCSRIPDFWQRHDPVLGAAASWGSEEVIRHLLEAGAKPESLDADSCTPLHRLAATTTLESTQMLLGIYGEEVRGHRFEGRLPVEAYIWTVLDSWDKVPDADVIRALVPRNIVSGQNGQGRKMWEFLCGLVPPKDRMASIEPWRICMEQLFAVYLQLGVMQAYEEETKECGILPLFSTYADLKLSTNWVSTTLLSNVQLETQFWSSAKESYQSVQFLKLAIGGKNLEMVKMLLELGLDVHRRVDGSSPIERACIKAVSLCSSESGKAVFETLLENSSSEKLRENRPEEGGLGLLHLLATRKNAANILWIIRALVDRGVDVNGRGRDSQGDPVIVHHLECFSFQCAELLLELGASPALTGPSSASYDALQAAVLVDNDSFLKTALARYPGTSSAAKWTRTMQIGLKAEEVVINNANALHLAAVVGASECMEFYLDNGLLNIPESISFEGYTPLHISAFKGNPKTMRILLDRQSDVMAETNDGRTSLHMAVQGRSLPAVQLLLEYGALESFDGLGKTPQSYAHELGLDEICQCLEESSKNGKGGPIMTRRKSLSLKDLKVLSKAFEQAIMADNKDECKRLLAGGCPIDIPLYTRDGYSPLSRALELEQLELAEWFIENGASVLKPVFPLNTTCIEFIAQKSRLSTLLPLALEKYCAQGGDLVSGDEFPFHRAVESGNKEGIQLLLLSLESCISVFAEKNQMSSKEALLYILNRQIVFQFSCSIFGGPGSHYSRITPLHLAAWRNTRDIASLLLDNGASVNAIDSNGWTPLMYAWTAEIADLLIHSGASIAAIYRRGPAPDLLYWFSQMPWRHQIYPTFFGHGEQSDQSRLPRPLVFNISTMHSTVLCQDQIVTYHDGLSLYDLGYDLMSDDGDGRSLMHCMICREDGSNFILESRFDLRRLSPFPWHLQWLPLGDIAFLRSRFREFSQKLPRDTFQRILNLEPKRGWSPLCRAASLDLVDVVENCLSMGARIDFEGCPVGSALMAASACASFKAVKFLVRRGASISYVGKEGVASCFAWIVSEEMRNWILAGRFAEQISIDWHGPNSRGQSSAAMKERPWAGIAQYRLVLDGARERFQSESRFEYARRLAFIRRSWRDRVVPVDDDGLVYPEVTHRKVKVVQKQIDDTLQAKAVPAVDLPSNGDLDRTSQPASSNPFRTLLPFLTSATKATDKSGGSKNGKAAAAKQTSTGGQQAGPLVPKSSSNRVKARQLLFGKKKD